MNAMNNLKEKWQE